MGTGEGKAMDRRGFLKLAGLGALGAAALPAGWDDGGRPAQGMPVGLP